MAYTMDVWRYWAIPLFSSVSMSFSSANRIINQGRQNDEYPGI